VILVAGKIERVKEGKVDHHTDLEEHNNHCRHLQGGAEVSLKARQGHTPTAVEAEVEAEAEAEVVRILLQGIVAFRGDAVQHLVRVGNVTTIMMKIDD
jgi:hypothetical protein